MKKFTDPFRYKPTPLVREAAESITNTILKMDESNYFLQGKMIGVLIVKGNKNNKYYSEINNEYGFLAAFSGNINGRSNLKGFVPPIYDLTTPDGHFKTEEKEISRINDRIKEIETCNEYLQAIGEVELLRLSAENEITKHKELILKARERREEIRKSMMDFDEESLLNESRFLKAELKRLQRKSAEEIEKAEARLNIFKSEITHLSNERQRRSDCLQKWIFKQFVVKDSLGNSSSILDIFAAKGLIPPGGTGECAAPKLLQYAYLNGYEPIAMGEFWVGRSPEGSVRNHGHFYPSCTSKCKILLEYMTNGLELIDADSDMNSNSCPDSNSRPNSCPNSCQNSCQNSYGVSSSIEILYEDNDIIAVNKPSGIPSVPGLDSRTSIEEMLDNLLETTLNPVHRLDMDTNGIILFAKNPESAASLREQFEKHSIRKTYYARLAGTPKVADKGRISLPLNCDYEDRPRQKVDKQNGKEAITDYEITGRNNDGTTNVIFHPFTGRTHQLRVHSAHHQGLGCPIVGDYLYGGHSSGYSSATLCLQAYSICFLHPRTNQKITISLTSTPWGNPVFPVE